MGKRGPKRTPTAILSKRGSRLVGSRRGEPTADPSTPAQPAWVKGHAIAYWRRAIKHLTAMGVLTVADGVALGMYCVYLDLWVKELGKGLAARSAPDLKEYANQVFKRERSFGLSPADRAGLVVEPQRQDKGKAKYFEPKIARSS